MLYEMQLKKPKMIIFDYGHTLCLEDDFDGLRGTEAVMKHAAVNKNNIGAKEICDFADSLYYGIGGKAHDIDIEIHNLISEKFMYEYLQIEFDLPMAQIERIFWDSAAPGKAMPNAEKALDYLQARDIRSGVVSNISFSGDNLAGRLNRMFPKNKFEFIIASSEYIFRKPHKMIFELALHKAGLTAGDAWFCGDSTKHDIAGAMNAGIFPVWYHSEIACNYRDPGLDKRPDFDHLYIRDWLELIDILEKLQ